MKYNKMNSVGSTIALAGLIVTCTMPGANAVMETSSTALSSQITVGKSLAASKSCTGCHGANLSGVPQFAPSLHQTGVLKEYNKKTFERVLASGITNDGTPVTKPMPVFHMKPAQSDAIYAYLKSLK